MSTNRYPHRIQSAHVESIDGELCVYDTARLRVHSLNHTAAFVWQRCDGRTAPAELAAALSSEPSVDDAEAVVRLTLHELAAVQLLVEPIDEVAQVSRRELLRRGVAAAALPAIFSIVAPAPAAAQSASGGQVSFAFTGADDTFLVPAGVVSLTIVASGAQGGVGLSVGLGAGGAGVLGGRTTATVPVTPGASLTVRVGGVAPNANAVIPTAGGFNGGGGSAANGGGGGGASSVRDGSTALVIAGGGGGGGAAEGSGVLEGGATGGAGGDLTANSGLTGPGGSPGGGGGQIVGGVGGIRYFGISSTNTNGTPGTADQGGSGGSDLSLVGGGGGGGGYRGGGGGSQLDDRGGAGGGGGSSFTAPGATGVVHQQGVNSGAGSITLSW